MIRAIAIAIALVSSVASSATAGTTSIAFTHSAPSNIVEYRVLLGFQSGNYTQEHSLGVPPVFGDVFVASLAIPDEGQVFIAVVAVDDQGVRSAPSNERVRTSSSSSENLLGPPGQPTILPQ